VRILRAVAIAIGCGVGGLLAVNLALVLAIFAVVPEVEPIDVSIDGLLEGVEAPHEPTEDVCLPDGRCLHPEEDVCQATALGNGVRRAYGVPLLVQDQVYGAPECLAGDVLVHDWSATP